MSSAKVECVCCKERKDRGKFCSPKLSVMYCAKFNVPLPTPTEHKSSHPVPLCAACLRVLAKKENRRRYGRQPKNRLSNNIKNGIRKSLRTGKPGLWESRVGYTLAELRRHLHNHFKPGMSWANYGANDGQWQIDHIKLVCSFDFNTYDDKNFKRCWSLSNLRPLWAKDNWERRKNREPMRKCFDESPYASSWIVLGPFISNIVADFVNDFTEKSLSGGKLMIIFPAKKAVPDLEYRKKSGSW